MKLLFLCFGCFIGYILAQYIIVKALKHKPADWRDCLILIGMTTVIQCGINLAFGETVMTPAIFGTIVVGCFFGQVIISEFWEDEQ